MAAYRIVHYLNQFFGGIGGEERISHSASEDRHLAPVKMRNCFVSRIEFRKCLYRYGCHDTRINIRTLEGILNRKRITVASIPM